MGGGRSDEVRGEVGFGNGNSYDLALLVREYVCPCGGGVGGGGWVFLVTERYDILSLALGTRLM